MGKWEGEANKEQYAAEKAAEQEKLTKVEIASKALKKGMTVAEIIELTGLNEGEISNLNH